MNLVIIVVMALAAYRVTRVITRDTILDDVRNTYYPDKDTTMLGELLTCDFCAGFWVSGVTTLIVNILFYDFGAPILVWLAVAGLQALLASWEG